MDRNRIVGILKKSIEVLRKEMTGGVHPGTNSEKIAEHLHGWISPDGQYIKLHPDAPHDPFIHFEAHKYTGVPRYSDISKALEDGWIKVGSSGNYNIGIHSDRSKWSKPALDRLRLQMTKANLDIPHLNVMHPDQADASAVGKSIDALQFIDRGKIS